MNLTDMISGCFCGGVAPFAAHAIDERRAFDLLVALREGGIGWDKASKEIEKAFKNPIEAKVEAKADVKMAQQDLDNLIKARTAIIKLDFQDRYGKRVY
jgi:hypothetical protein